MKYYVLFLTLSALFLIEPFSLSLSQVKSTTKTILTDNPKPKTPQIGYWGNTVPVHSYLYKGEARFLGSYVIIPEASNNDGVSEAYNAFGAGYNNSELHWLSFSNQFQAEQQLHPFQGNYESKHYCDANKLTVGQTYSFASYAYSEIPTGGTVGGRAAIGLSTRYVHIIPYSIPITSATSANGSFGNINFSWSAPAPLYCTIDHYELYRRDADSVRITELSLAERVVGDISSSATSLGFNYGKRNTNSFYALVCYDQYGEAIGISRSYQVTLPNLTFSLTAPVDGTISTTLTPTLDWNDYGSGNTYKLTYSENSDFSNSTVITGITQSQYTFSSSLSDHKTYYWKVEVEGQSIISNQTGWAFFTNSVNQAPSNFALLSPTNNSDLDSKRPKLEWEASTDTGDKITYNVIIATDNNFNNVVLDDLAYTNYYWVNAELSDDTQFYCKVKATDSQSNSTWSDIRSFTTRYNNYPSNFELLSPKYNGGIYITDERPVETGLTPTFTWNTSSDSDFGSSISYTLWYSQDVTFTTKTEVSGLSTNSYTPSVALEEDKQYYWRVFAIDNTMKQTENLGKPYSFVTNSSNSSTTKADLLTPIDNTTVNSESITFSWSAITDTDIYDCKLYSLFISSDQSFTNIIYSSENMRSTTSIEIPYLSAGSYYWKVVSKVIKSNQTIALNQESSVFRINVNARQISITSPSGSSLWYNNNSYYINWTTNFVSNKVKIEYSTDNGSNWNLVIDNLQSSSKTYRWDINSIISSTTCKVKITDTDKTVESISDVFQINQLVLEDDTIDLYFIADGGTKIKKLNSTGISTIFSRPTGGLNFLTVDRYNQKVAFSVGTEIWVMRNDGTDGHKITSLYIIGFMKWCEDGFNIAVYGNYNNAGNGYGVFKINIIDKSISSWLNTENVTIMNSNSYYDWNVAKDKFVYMNSGTNEIINANFNYTLGTISNSIAVTPQSEAIGWMDFANNGNYSLYTKRQNGFDVIYKNDFQNSIRTELKTYSNQTIFGKLHPNSSSAYIVDVNSNSLYCISTLDTDGSNYFNKIVTSSILGSLDLGSINYGNSISLLSPMGSENLIANQYYNITWDSKNITSVKIEYSTNSGTDWTTITSSAPGYLNGYYWLVPDLTSLSCRLRITDAENSSVTSTSLSNFSILQTAINLTYPTENENFEAGLDYTLQWTQSATLKVDIYLSTNNGSSWSLVKDSIDATSLQYSWTVPNVNSTTCKIKLIGYGYDQVTSISNNFTVTPIFTISTIDVNGSLYWLGGDAAWGDYDNNGSMDLVVSYQLVGSGYYGKLYKNNSGSFSLVQSNLIGRQYGVCRWSDYDRNGYLDFLITGSPDYSAFNNHIYRNNINSDFSTIYNLEPLYLCSADWGDVNNDGTPDLIYTGNTRWNNGVRINQVLINRNNNFTIDNSYQFNLPVVNGFTFTPLEWGDFNNDGYLDLLIHNKIYRNDNGVLVDLGVNLGSPTNWEYYSKWWDYDEDGYLDIITTSKIFKNNQQGDFIEISTNYSSSVSFGDYNNDGKVDVFTNTTVGRNDGDHFSYFSSNLTDVPRFQVDYDNNGLLDFQTENFNKIMVNSCSTINHAPTIPLNLQVLSISASELKLCWDSASDQETPTANLTYNVRVGTTPGGYDIISPLSDPLSGFRRLPKMGNAYHTLFKRIKNLPAGTYYWSVQAIDGIYSGGQFAPEKSFTVDQTGALPVELTKFEVELNNSRVRLLWETATEVNNYGFEILRCTQSDKWEKIGFVQGHGNSNSTKEYSFLDNTTPSGKIQYRLKQVDFDGKYEYSNTIEITVEFPTEFKLTQNYPNPFNPSTTIQYELPESGLVSLKVYDVLGNEVATLVNEDKTAGCYEVTFDVKTFQGMSLPSGVYFYQLRVGNFVETKKLLLMK